MGKTMSTIRLNIIIFFLLVYIAVLLLVCLFVYYMNLYVLFQIDPFFMF